MFAKDRPIPWNPQLVYNNDSGLVLLLWPCCCATVCCNHEHDCDSTAPPQTSSNNRAKSWWTLVLCLRPMQWWNCQYCRILAHNLIAQTQNRPHVQHTNAQEKYSDVLEVWPICMTICIAALNLASTLLLVSATPVVCLWRYRRVRNVRKTACYAGLLLHRCLVLRMTLNDK